MTEIESNSDINSGCVPIQGIIKNNNELSYSSQQTTESQKNSTKGGLSKRKIILQNLNLNDIINKTKQSDEGLKLEKDEDGFDRPTPLRIKSVSVSPNKIGGMLKPTPLNSFLNALSPNTSSL